jgi:hypothetical protein
LVYDETAYQLLIENLKKLGFMSDADICYYQFRVGQFLHQNPIDDPIMFILNFGSWIFYGFGKKPLYPVVWSVFFVVLFGFLWISIGSKEPESAIIGKARAWIKWSFVLILLFITLNVASSYLTQATISPMLLVLLLFLLSTIIRKARAWIKWSFVLILLFITSDVTSSYLMHATISPMLLMLLLLLLIIGIVLSVKSVANEDIEPQSWPKNIPESVSFSAAIFLSGTKFFVDPPALPELPGRSQLLIKRAFLFERLLGAFFSILLFLAVGATVVR